VPVTQAPQKAPAGQQKNNCIFGFFAGNSSGQVSQAKYLDKKIR
jgi:hypothetical protein